ncbi:MAG: molybdopterin-synthase adenylyltransferase MoeB [Polyangiaceae bacterium]|nr:molybdopterin-synthase adenylyltransferase MoeB [Polyangiaceae bacterium]
MPTTYNDLIASVRRETKEVSLAELKRRLDAKESYVLLDVRDKEEFRTGHIPGALSLPRGFLEIQVEALIPNKSTKIVTYCGSGARSALAAKTLADLGYTNVETANPGFVHWKELGYPFEMPPQLTDVQRNRYKRHLLLSEIGESGQLKLLKSRVLLIGVGGLGSPISLYLTAAGVGTLGIVDADKVDASNLQRQLLHATSRIGQPKVESAQKVLSDLNPDVKVVGYNERITSKNVDRLVADYDVIVDGTDNYQTRYLINDAAIFHGKPVVHGSVFRYDGQLTTFVPESAAKKLGIEPGPCYRCLYPEPPPPHLAPGGGREAGLLGILPGVIGVLEATETIKLLLGLGEPLVGRLLTYDSLRAKFHELKLRRDPDCAACGPHKTITDYVDYDGFCSVNRD